MKHWAYRQDQLVTTHPIAGEVPDTEQTFLNFDGITYGKGAAVIKQLVAAIGMEGFRDGMRIYFARHAYGNTTLVAVPRRPRGGRGPRPPGVGRLWLETPSLNTIAARAGGARRRTSGSQLTQAAPEDYPTLRPHHLEIALVRAARRRARQHRGRPRRPRGSRGVDRGAPAGARRPTSSSRTTTTTGTPASCSTRARSPSCRASLGAVADPLLRQLIWRALWKMVRSARHSSLAFLELVRTRLPDERDDQILLAALDASRGALARYVPEERRMDEARRFVAAALEALELLPEGDLRTLWLRAAIGAAAESADVAALARVVDQEPGRPRVRVDREMRWAVAALAVAHDLPGAAERVAAERAADPTDRGERAALRAEAGAPDAAVKAAAWERIHGEGYGSFHLTQAAMLGFNHAHQAAPPGALRGPLLRGAAGGGRRARPPVRAGVRHGALPGVPSGARRRGARPHDGRRAGRRAAEPAAAAARGGGRHGARGRLPLVRVAAGARALLTRGPS